MPLLFSFFFILNSCKKDVSISNLSTSEKAENAKNWYLNQQKNIKSIFISSAGDSVKLKFSPKWEKALVEDIDGKSVLVAIVQTNLRRASDKETEFAIIIVNEENSYDYKIASVKKTNENTKLTVKDLYLSAFTENNISKDNSLQSEINIYNRYFQGDKKIIYNQNGRTSIDLNQSSKNLNSINGKSGEKLALSSNDIIKLSSQTQCIDWYLVTTVYIDGIAVSSYEQFVYRTCTAGDQPVNPEDGGVEENTENIFEDIDINWGNEDDTKISQSAGESEADIRNVYVSWYAYRAGSLRFKSFEKIKIKKALIGDDYITGLEHISMSAEGNIPGQTAEPVLNYAEDRSDEMTARIKLSFKDKRTYMRNGVIESVSSKDKIAPQTWHLAELVY